MGIWPVTKNHNVTTVHENHFGWKTHGNWNWNWLLKYSSFEHLHTHYTSLNAYTTVEKKQLALKWLFLVFFLSCIHPIQSWWFIHVRQQSYLVILTVSALKVISNRVHIQILCATASDVQHMHVAIICTSDPSQLGWILIMLHWLILFFLINNCSC